MIGLIKGTARQVKSVSGLPLPIATYNGNLKAPIKKLSLSVNPTQSGSGDPAPDNIRPISGVSEVNLNNSGENTYTTTGIWAVASATITVISTDAFRIQRASNWSSTKQPNANIGLEVGKTYCLVCDVEYTSGTAYIAIRNSSNAIQSGTGKILESKKVYFYFTLANATDFLSFFCSYNESVGDVTYRNIHLYEIKTNYNLPLDGTRYGGTIDIVDGEAVMTVTHYLDEYDGSNDESWSLYSSSGLRYSYYILRSYTQPAITSAAAWKSNSIPVSLSSENTPEDANRMTCRGTAYSSKKLYIFAPPTDIPDLTALRSYLSNHPFQFWYPITPFTVNLGSVSIPSLLGQNNIWHDGNGDVDELVYVNRQLYFGR